MLIEEPIEKCSSLKEQFFDKELVLFIQIFLWASERKKSIREVVFLESSQVAKVISS